MRGGRESFEELRAVRPNAPPPWMLGWFGAAASEPLGAALGAMCDALVRPLGERGDVEGEEAAEEARLAEQDDAREQAAARRQLLRRVRARERVAQRAERGAERLGGGGASSSSRCCAPPRASTSR